MTLNLNIEPGLEQRLREQAARRGLAPDSYAVAAIEEKLQLDSRPSRRLTHVESELLSQINAGLPEDMWMRYDQLVEKRRSESLMPQEYDELMRLTNTVEEDHAPAHRLAGETRQDSRRVAGSPDAGTGDWAAPSWGSDQWLSGRAKPTRISSPHRPEDAASIA